MVYDVYGILWLIIWLSAEKRDFYDIVMVNNMVIY